MALFELTSAVPFAIDYGRDVEDEIDTLAAEIAKQSAVAAAYPARWLAIKLLEQDHDLQQKVLLLPGGAPVLTHAQLSYARLAKQYGEDLDAELADRRYNWIHALVQHTLVKTNDDAYTLSDKIDRVLTNRWLGLPIFLAAMWVVFKLTADVSAPYLDWIAATISGPLSGWTTSLLGALGLGGTWFESLLVDGVIAGVGGVLVFVPVLMALYFGLAVLEDSGYMARAAFVMDTMMSRIGLHGKSFLPLLVGFGCSVPAIYATRTLENDKDRVLTALLVPFMSCGARLPVYILFAAIFFPQYAGLLVFSLYLLGILTAVIIGMILRRTMFQEDEQTAFIMELPPYRLPNLRSIWFHMWQRTRAFLESAWTLILAVSIVIWFMMAVPVQGENEFADTAVDESLFATVSGALAPALEPLGFGSWEASGALISGFVAKEVVVSTMAQVYAVDDLPADETETTFLQDVVEIGRSFMQATLDTIKSLPLIVGIDLFDEADDAPPSALMEAIRSGFEETSGGHGALAAVSFMVFVLIYTPCMVAAAAEKQELGAKWMWVSIFGQFALAWLMAFAVFQGGVLLGLG
jgi:ferrous iron transport protein B